MATTIFTRFLNGDYTRLTAGQGPVRIDWNGDAQLHSGYGIHNLQVGLWASGDFSHDRLGILPGSGVTLSNGFNEKSQVSINGYPAVVGRGGSGTLNFWIWFPDPEHPTQPRLAPPAVVQTFIRALTFETTLATLPDDFSRRISFMISNGGEGNSGYEVIQEFVTLTKWLPGNGPDHGGPDPSGGGGNLPPVIAGHLTRITLPDGGAPLSQVTITDAVEDVLMASVGIGEPHWGYFLASSLSGGTYNAQTGIYTVSGTAAQVQAAIQNLVFVATPRSEGARASLASVFFTIDVSDGKASTSARLDADLWINRADVIKGKSSSEKLYGFSGKDKLYGNGGHDKLFGGSGSDMLTGGKGKDTFVFDTKPNKKKNLDKITDFKVKDDSFWLDNAVFAKLGKKGTEAKPAQLKKSFFTIGDKAKDKNDYIAYDNKKGKLYYDADGSGKGKAVEIATLSKNLLMTHKDFFVI